MISSDAMRGYNDVLILAILHQGDSYYIKAIRTVTKLAKKFANEPPDNTSFARPPFTPPSTV